MAIANVLYYVLVLYCATAICDSDSVEYSVNVKHMLQNTRRESAAPLSDKRPSLGRS